MPFLTNKKKNPVILLLMFVLLALSVTGCALFQSSGNSGEENKPIETEKPVAPANGEKSKVIPFVYTTKKELSLTFNGMGDESLMTKLLDELDRYDIKATFFLPGMRVAEEPEVAKEILARGHGIENNTLSRLDLTHLSYEQVFKEINVSNEVIEKELGVKPQYMRTRSGDYNDTVQLAAAQSGLSAVVSYSLNLHEWQQESEQEKADYIRKYVTRGGIIALDTELDGQVLESIPLIAKAAAEVGYKLVPLKELVGSGQERKPLEQIPGFDAARKNLNDKQSSYKLIYNWENKKKVVSLTFDDWGTDYTITKLLDILEKHDVKATFFLRANGVEKNPNLAKAIAEAGHDVANHTYSHPVITKLTPEQLQEEVVKAHQVITEAIQQQPTMLFRPPTGEIDDERARIVAATGYTSIAMYDVTVFDWDSANDADHIVKGVLDQTVDGSVILLHMLDNIHTIEALPDVIEKLKSKGYAFVPMSQMSLK
ncbi:chitin deacetylase [Paenibacillus sp. FSL A5-0031]|uniref:polysaccharide deacetylase family protein n=1 Tax=Paenibacillus sp. FSL A5-0031 TaxID=1920420 RepID=UPI00096E20DC|nr:polysaccharide deacetylase family protein [Paenibacillus sp. FSL A5-0031]OME78958.1 chitin deacetylase [Paenibacillus sp. FSL A5-0031]